MVRIVTATTSADPFGMTAKTFRTNWAQTALPRGAEFAQVTQELSPEHFGLAVAGHDADDFPAAPWVTPAPIRRRVVRPEPPAATTARRAGLRPGMALRIGAVTTCGKEAVAFRRDLVNARGVAALRCLDRLCRGEKLFHGTQCAKEFLGELQERSVPA
ncbi:hypothetical protein GCM10009536_13800 [Streptomyces thermocarboxydus]|jgi:hypothetical protein|uniref:Uncharacterized protein n=1 Tax=Streptomyces thermodiastaticus TaxID=44061 RepID=A0ABU0KE53_9ACTN|nr:hypothetical protein [Streptomyces thermodiastaticus]